MSIILFLIILIALILVHEFGHFIVAKRSGVRVDEFGLGFPPKLWGKKYGETEYTLNALPFGGFVRIFGEDPSEESLRSTRSMVRKPWYIKAAIIVAGVGMNFIFAWLLFVIGFLSGMPQAVSPDDHVSGARMLVAHVLHGSPAEKAGLKSGDVIISIEVRAEKVLAEDAKAVSDFIAAHDGSLVLLTYERKGERATLETTPVVGLVPGEPERAAIGFSLGLVVNTPLSFSESIYQASVLTGTTFVAITASIAGFIWNAFTLSADLSQITGPIGIVGLVGDASTLGFVALLTFTAFISLNLAVINLLPFPALDGGRLIVTLAEAIRGKMFPSAIVNAANGIGFALLILLMILVTWNDVMRLVG